MVNIFAILSIYWRSIDLVNSCSIDFVFQIPTVKKIGKVLIWAYMSWGILTETHPSSTFKFKEV